MTNQLIIFLIFVEHTILSSLAREASFFAGACVLPLFSRLNSPYSISLGLSWRAFPRLKFATFESLDSRHRRGSPHRSRHCFDLPPASAIAPRRSMLGEQSSLAKLAALCSRHLLQPDSSTRLNRGPAHLDSKHHLHLPEIQTF